VSDDKVDETYLLERSPKLESLSNEVLRMTVTSSLARVVMEPTMLSGKLLQPGNKIMVRSDLQRKLLSTS
jgi:cholesterol 7alpha-monooxygenase